jgi:hypothetical protein
MEIAALEKAATATTSQERQRNLGNDVCEDVSYTARLLWRNVSPPQWRPLKASHDRQRIRDVWVRLRQRNPAVAYCFARHVITMVDDLGHEISHSHALSNFAVAFAVGTALNLASAT